MREDLWLLKFRWPAGEAADPLAALRERAGTGAGVGAGASAVRAWRALEGDEVYAYLPAGMPRPALVDLAPAGADLRRLTCTLDVPGASHGADAPFHYVVETDVAAGHEADFDAWYDQEHLPGLAAVHGTVRALRYLCLDASPRHHACYDLASLDTFGSAAWLAVRATDWSSRVRPSFRNTKRTMFRRL
jgi:hypothetical protein